MKRTLLVVLAGLSLAAVWSTAATAVPPPSVDFGQCAFANNGNATAPAGQPITLTNTGGWATGTSGLSSVAYKSVTATATIAVTGGSTTTAPLAYSPPQFFGDPFNAWLILLPNITLDALAANGSVVVTIAQTTTQPFQVVFPGQRGKNHFGPFHIPGGNTFESQCTISAS